MQTLEILAEEHETFEETMQKVTYETEESDIPFEVAYETTEELDKAQKDQDSLQDELEAMSGTPRCHVPKDCRTQRAKRPFNSNAKPAMPTTGPSPTGNDVDELRRNM